MKIREHRGSLAESMETVCEIEPTLEAVVDHMHADKGWPGLYAKVTPETVRVEKYGSGTDPRIGWNTHIVTIEGYGVYGFTDGPIH